MFFALVLSNVGVALIIVFCYKRFVNPLLHQDQVLPAVVSLGVVEHGNRESKKIALTFDADMTPGMLKSLKTGAVKSLYNEHVKEILDKTNTKATIFLGGLWVDTYANEAKALATDPLIEIGNHSYKHYAFASCFGLPILPNKEDVDDVEMAQRVIIEKTGVTPKYFRFPGGCYENLDLKIIMNLGLTIVQWDTVSGDSFNKDTESIIRNVEDRVQNGSIIVMHIHGGKYAPKTNEALIKIIPDLKKRGFEFVKMSELEL